MRQTTSRDQTKAIAPAFGPGLRRVTKGHFVDGIGQDFDTGFRVRSKRGDFGCDSSGLRDDGRGAQIEPA